MGYMQIRSIGSWKSNIQLGSCSHTIVFVWNENRENYLRSELFSIVTRKRWCASCWTKQWQQIRTRWKGSAVDGFRKAFLLFNFDVNSSTELHSREKSQKSIEKSLTLPYRRITQFFWLKVVMCSQSVKIRMGKEESVIVMPSVPQHWSLALKTSTSNAFSAVPHIRLCLPMTMLSRSGAHDMEFRIEMKMLVEEIWTD